MEMSNESKETIADIVAWIRRHASVYGYDLADRIEAAAKRQFRDTTKMIPEEVAVSKMETTTPTCEKSSQVGNAAAMREEKASLMQRLEMCQKVNEQQEKEYLALKSENARLRVRLRVAAPLRNCDIMDWRTAWAKWRTECHPQKPCGYADALSGTEQFMDWYMSEAKGDAEWTV